MMKKLNLLLLLVFVFTLTGCGEESVTYNFKRRQDSTFFSSDEMIIIDYKSDLNGQMVEFNIDRLLTIEEMLIFNPSIDLNITVEGFTGDVFVRTDNRCTTLVNDLLVPINIEIGSTKFKYDEEDCKYVVVNNYNEPKNLSIEYYLDDTILKSKNVDISVIIYNPDEVVKFTELFDLPHTLESLGLYTIRINETRDGFLTPLVNYYHDMTIYEQLYIKHQGNEDAVNEIRGISDDLNLLDLSEMFETTPLVEDFNSLYVAEFRAVEELQEKIGIGFVVEEIEDPTEEETTTEEE